MPSIGTTLYLALVVAWGASFYQWYVNDFFAVTLGIGRVIQTIDEFPYTCRRIEHPRLEACEDIWLDNEAKTLYAACAGTEGRLQWSPAMKHLNATGRRPGGSELIALDIDYPGADGLYNLRAIKPAGYNGATGDESLDFVGFDAQILDGDTIRFYLINLRPPVGAFNNIIDATKLGANATIEVFETRRGEDQMRHLRTVWSPAVWSPNRVAAVGGGAFFVTNDHSGKIGWRRELDDFIGGGNVAYCDGNGECHAAFNGDEEDEDLPQASMNEPKYKALVNRALKLIPKTKLKFPNGLTRGFDGLIYVPSSVDGQIRVFSINDDNTLKQLDTIHVRMPLDNVSPDAKGDLYVPGFPSGIQSAKGLANPYEEISPVSIWRIRKTVDLGPDGVRSVDYRVEKVIEDRDAKVLSGATTIRHDVKTGRLFISAAVHPFLAVCEPR
ncbi:calcium-dependent phosphotriesterase [Cucurbitaria berberidis CBS 394.84]|uniref:Calcium-dependent phosphotriesterase n=1 Tax=Cucurbitaria berberidis CBS 394.84 TaxID=1168544 RepID=A0A9P4LE53_9PLEO|nr:calcium-dependent phosphotriesterase [Cucurbitaria berberidis CBS 394.84]KAF1850774.1 calcium-dependent phosphotriesterase [Cucurbitaria berberidis CBS 394.84]